MSSVDPDYRRGYHHGLKDWPPREDPYPVYGRQRASYRRGYEAGVVRRTRDAMKLREAARGWPTVADGRRV